MEERELAPIQRSDEVVYDSMSIDLSSSEATENAKQVTINAENNYDDTAPVQTSGAFKIGHKEPKKIQKRVPTESSEKSKRTSGGSSLLMNFLRKDPSNFNFSGQGNNRDFDLPEQQMENRFNEFLDMALNSSNPLNFTPSALTQNIIQCLIRSGIVPAPAQVYKAFDYFIERTEVKDRSEISDEYKNSSVLSNLIRLNKNLQIAKDKYYSENKDEIERGNFYISTAAEIIKSRPGERATPEVLNDLQNLMDTRPEVILINDYYTKELGMTYDQMRNEFRIMWDDLSKKLKLSETGPRLQTKNPDLSSPRAEEPKNVSTQNIEI